MKNTKNLPKEQIGIAIPVLSLLLGIFPLFRTFTTLMTFIYSEDISSILFTKTELIIYLLLSVLIIISLILICLRKTFAIYTYYLFTLLTLLTTLEGGIIYKPLNIKGKILDIGNELNKLINPRYFSQSALFDFDVFLFNQVREMLGVDKDVKSKKEVVNILSSIYKNHCA